MDVTEQAQAAFTNLRDAIRHKKTAKALRIAANLVDENLWECFQEDDGTAFVSFGEFVNSTLLELAEE